jgi:hypothetical protein
VFTCRHFHIIRSFDSCMLYVHIDVTQQICCSCNCAAVIKISLKVHKIENFFGFDFEFYTVSLLVMLKYEGFVTKYF